ncbi:MAG: hypothetical protein O7E55_07295 [Chloroflexi bacterium]|nr:hypothetical protein [Chloroflexota bacterium]
MCLALIFALAFRVNNTLLEPEFVKSQLRDGDVYNYLHDEVLPAALDEIGENASDTPVDLTLLKDDITLAAREIFPPAWLQQQSELTIDETLSYLTGDEDSFEITIPLSDRVEAARDALKQTVTDGVTLDVVYDEVLLREAIESVGNLNDLPLGIALTETEVESALEQIVEREWLRGEIVGAADEVVPYFTGQREEFAVVIDVASRVVPAQRVLKEILKEADTRQFLFDEMIDPQIEEVVGLGMALPFGITLTSQEVQDSVREVLPRQWVDQRIDDTVDQIVAFLTNQDESFNLTVPFEDRKTEAVRVVGELADRKLAETYASLPLCTAQQLAQMNVGSLAATGLECRIPFLTIEQIQQQAGVVINSHAEAFIDERLPDSWQFTEEDLREHVGSERWESIVQVREWLTSGYIYTSSDLREDLAKSDFTGDDDAWNTLGDATRLLYIENSEKVRNLDRVRGWMANGLSFSSNDLERKLQEDTESFDFARFDVARRGLGLVRDFSFLGWVFLIALLGLAGFLGGRTLSGKLTWAAVFLGIAGLVIYVAAGPVYEAVPGSMLREGINEALADSDGVNKVVLAKVTEVTLNASDDFVSGIKFQGLLFLAVGLALLAATGVQALVLRRGRRLEEPVPVEVSPTTYAQDVLE